MKRAQELSVNGFRQPYLRRNSPRKEVKDALAVHPLRRSGQPKQNLRLKERKGAGIAVRGRMVRFVDDDIVIVLRGQLRIQFLRVQRLHGNEQMLCGRRSMVAHIELSKIDILEHGRKRIAALSEDLLSMRYEQQPVCLSGVLSAKPPVIQRGDNGFSPCPWRPPPGSG